VWFIVIPLIIYLSNGKKMILWIQCDFFIYVYNWNYYLYAYFHYDNYKRFYWRNYSNFIHECYFLLSYKRIIDILTQYLGFFPKLS
jgi:hypothetical protein